MSENYLNRVVGGCYDLVDVKRRQIEDARKYGAPEDVARLEKEMERLIIWLRENPGIQDMYN